MTKADRIAEWMAQNPLFAQVSAHMCEIDMNSAKDYSEMSKLQEKLEVEADAQVKPEADSATESEQSQQQEAGDIFGDWTEEEGENY